MEENQTMLFSAGLRDRLEHLSNTFFVRWCKLKLISDAIISISFSDFPGVQFYYLQIIAGKSRVQFEVVNM